MNTIVETNASNEAGAASPSAHEHRLRSERIAAQGVQLSASKAKLGRALKYLLPLCALAALASVMFAPT